MYGECLTVLYLFMMFYIFLQTLTLFSFSKHLAMQLYVVKIILPIKYDQPIIFLQGFDLRFFNRFSSPDKSHRNSTKTTTPLWGSQLHSPGWGSRRSARGRCALTTVAVVSILLLLHNNNTIATTTDGSADGPGGPQHSMSQQSRSRPLPRQHDVLTTRCPPDAEPRLLTPERPLSS